MIAQCERKKPSAASEQQKWVLVFDLDDTLYSEIAFVESGFRTVAEFLAGEMGVDATEAYRRMRDLLHRNGRGRVFDDVLLSYGALSRPLVKRCVSEYRAHDPKIELLPDAIRCLKRFAKYPLYIVTDGTKTVQRRKIEALGVAQYVDVCYVTHQHGTDRAKPSPYCFLRICDREKTDASRVVYIGDNPAKDFIGIKPLGFRTARIIRGAHAAVRKAPIYEAHAEIHSLDELTEEFLAELFRAPVPPPTIAS